MRQLISLIQEKNARIIGIDGLGGAGKSTVSEQIADLLRAQGHSVTLLHIDDFIHPRAVRYREDVPAWQCYYDLQWKYEPLLELLDSVRRNGAFRGTLLLYDKENDGYVPTETEILKDGIVIVEGVFLQRPELEGQFDLTVYIDVPEEIRLQRVLRRDSYIGDTKAIAEKYERRYFPAERFYVEKCRPAECADYTVKFCGQDR